jgi:uncharacterized protein (TIGR00255 family)
MTGFGRAERKSGSFLVGVEIRSVNHRHAELRVKVPSTLSGLEDGLRQRLAAAVSRGRVDATVSVSGLDEVAPIEINHALIGAYLTAAGEVARKHGVNGDVPLQTLLSLPGAVSVRAADGALSAPQRQAVEESFEAALGELQKARAIEGKHLAADFAKRLKTIATHRAKIEKAAKGVTTRYAKKLQQRVEEIGGGKLVEPARLAQEIAILASRSDITEELVRLEGHLNQAATFLKAGGDAVGKRLDFLLQEMHREANTVNSKSEDLGISREALAIKAEVEKLREQVQNIE